MYGLFVVVCDLEVEIEGFEDLFVGQCVDFVIFCYQNIDFFDFVCCFVGCSFSLCLNCFYVCGGWFVFVLVGGYDIVKCVEKQGVLDWLL